MDRQSYNKLDIMNKNLPQKMKELFKFREMEG